MALIDTFFFVFPNAFNGGQGTAAVVNFFIFVVVVHCFVIVKYF